MELLCVWFVAGLFFAVIGGMVTGGKGRGRSEGQLLGLVFGPLGLLIALILGPGTKGKVRCPECKEFVQPGAKVCKHCGYRPTEHGEGV